MKKYLALVLFVPLLWVSIAGAQDSGNNNQPPPYITEQMVQQNCPLDAVVWLDSRTGLYYPADQHRNRYATTRNGDYATGQYVCLENARHLGAVPAYDWQ